MARWWRDQGSQQGGLKQQDIDAECENWSVETQRNKLQMPGRMGHSCGRLAKKKKSGGTAGRIRSFMIIPSAFCGGVDDVVCALTLVRRGVAQGFPCPSCRGAQGKARGRRGRRGKGKNGQEEVEEVESGEGRVKERQPCGWPWMEVKSAQNLSHECECDDQGLWDNACRLRACCDAPRHRRSALCQRRHWCSQCCALCPACCCTRRSNFPCCDTLLHLTRSRSHFYKCFHCILTAF